MLLASLSFACGLILDTVTRGRQDRSECGIWPCQLQLSTPHDLRSALMVADRSCEFGIFLAKMISPSHQFLRFGMGPIAGFVVDAGTLWTVRTNY